MKPAAPLPYPEIDDSWLRQHRSHDVTWLLQRWRAVARAARMNLQVIHETAGFPVYFLTSRKVSARPLYLSSGVHGDEAGSALGLLEWAERSIAWLRSADVICLPIFNPVGLALNTRTDADSQDLNRMFDHPSHPHIVGWRQAMAAYQPRMAVCLHEDYDAQGLYAYELNRDPKLRLAERCLAQAESILPRDSRRTIEGRPALAAIIRRRRLPMFENLPEAVALYQKGTGCTLTFETPSEYALSTRVRAQMALLQTIADWDNQRGT
jgi:murein peptide amidase A